MRLFQDGSIASATGRDAVGAACEAGAEALVSACPFCEINLEAGARQQEAPFAVYDIIDIVYEGIFQDIHDN
jgi:Fe-S oxidoreductase